MPSEWISAAAVIAAARLFYGNSESAVRAIVWRAALGLLRARAGHIWIYDVDDPRSAAAGGRTSAGVAIGARLWLDLHDCLYRGAGPAIADWRLGDFNAECGVVREGRGMVAGIRWFAFRVTFWAPDLPFGLDGTAIDAPHDRRCDTPGDALGDAPDPARALPPGARRNRFAGSAAMAGRLRRPLPIRRGALMAHVRRRAGPRVVVIRPAAPDPAPATACRRALPRPQARPPPSRHGRRAA